MLSDWLPCYPAKLRDISKLKVKAVNKRWAEVVARYEHGAASDPAVRGMLTLSRHITASPLASGLYGWTSMLDLCIAQTAVTYPYDGPYLRVSPLAGGQIEFRYLDTHEKEKQWHRTVEAVEAVPRLLKFLHQLHWFPPEDLRQ